MAPTYAKGLVIQLTAWFIIANALAYAAYPVFYFLENSSLSSWTLFFPFGAIIFSIYLIKFGGTIKNGDQTTPSSDDE